jgi:hypothetical protein
MSYAHHLMCVDYKSAKKVVNAGIEIRRDLDSEKNDRVCVPLSIPPLFTLELLSALRYPRLTQALYIVTHGLGDIWKVLLYRRFDGESRQ